MYLQDFAVFEFSRDILPIHTKIIPITDTITDSAIMILVVVDTLSKLGIKAPSTLLFVLPIPLKAVQKRHLRLASLVYLLYNCLYYFYNGQSRIRTCNVSNVMIYSPLWFHHHHRLHLSINFSFWIISLEYPCFYFSTRL